MLVGSYNHKLDSKGRTVLPAKFRGELGSSVVATIGIDRCIALYPVPRWEELLLKLKDLSSFKKKTRDFRRVLLSMATEQEIDGAGRILIPQILRDYADRRRGSHGDMGYGEVGRAPQRGAFGFQRTG